MTRGITVLWLVDEPDLPAERDATFRHVVRDPASAAATMTGLLADGAVLAVVRSEEEGQRAIAHGADEVVLLCDAKGSAFHKAVERTAARARARLNRDLLLMDLVRQDDTAALELLAAALGEVLLEPLSRAEEDSLELCDELPPGAEGHRAQAIADTVARAARVAEQMRELVSVEPRDEVVDLAAVAGEVLRTLAPRVRAVAALEVEIDEYPCLVGMPRWQIVMMVAALMANAVDSVAARGQAERAISVRVSPHGGAVVLEVMDNGMGVPEAEPPYASDLFYATSATGHLGLGLTMVSSRLRRAGGSLVFESDQGVGTTVRAFVPLLGRSPNERSN